MPSSPSWRRFCCRRWPGRKSGRRAILCLNNTKQLAPGLATLRGRSRRPVALQSRHGGIVVPHPAQLGQQRHDLGSFGPWIRTTPTPPRSPTPSLGPYISGATTIYRCPSDHVVERGPKRRRLGRAHPQLFNERDGRRRGRHLRPTGSTSTIPITRSFLKSPKFPNPPKFLCFSTSIRTASTTAIFSTKPSKHLADLSGSAYSVPNGLICRPLITIRRRRFRLPTATARLHRWMQPDTYRPPMPDAANLPISVPAAQQDGLRLVIDHMSVDQQLTAPAGFTNIAAGFVRPLPSPARTACLPVRPGHHPRAG